MFFCEGIGGGGGGGGQEDGRVKRKRMVREHCEREHVCERGRRLLGKKQESKKIQDIDGEIVCVERRDYVEIVRELRLS